MKTPAEYARSVEDRPVLAPGDGERVYGYGVMGLPFASGHVLGLRRWAASSVGDRFTSIWHRGPSGRWTFYESTRSEVACTPYLEADVEGVQEGPIVLDWEGPNRLRVRTADGGVDWEIALGGTTATRMMSATGNMHGPAWRSGPFLKAMGVTAGRVLGVGNVQITGPTSNHQHSAANPLRIWYVTASHAVVEGEDLGPIGRLDEQAPTADFHFPQRGIFALGRVFISPLTADHQRTEPVHARPR
jgi:hypothetical protein